MVRFGVALSAAAIASVVLTVSAQQAPPQTPPPQTPQQQPEPPAQQPIFRVGADVIRLDVSVLDKDRKPIHGLTSEDFTVVEEGKPQRVVAVAEIDAARTTRRRPRGCGTWRPTLPTTISPIRSATAASSRSCSTT